MIETVVTIFASIFVFQYIFWKRLKEDYLPAHIFTTGFYALFSLGVGAFISSYFASIFWFWISLVFSLFGVFAGILRFRLKIIEVIDAYAMALVPVLSLVFLTSFIIQRDLDSLFVSVFIFIALIVYLLVDKHYKKFTWYKSGRIGFTGFFVIATLFLVRFVIALVQPDMVSFVGRVDVLISALVSCFAFLVIYYLSRKN